MIFTIHEAQSTLWKGARYFLNLIRLRKDGDPGARSGGYSGGGKVPRLERAPRKRNDEADLLTGGGARCLSTSLSEFPTVQKDVRKKNSD